MGVMAPGWVAHSKEKKLLPLAVILYGMGLLGELLSTLALLLKPTFGGLVPNVTPKVE